MIIEHISKSYGKKNILKDVNLNIKKGSCVGILGGNGSGKSTLMNILAGICKADSGRFSYDSVSLSSNPKVRSEIIGYVPQNTPLIDELNARDNLRLWYDDENKINTSLSSGVLNMLGIHEFIKTPVCKMSGGMKKRLSIGCAVARNPKVLLLDEPSAALDLICKEKISHYLINFKNNGGIILLATHDVHELNICDELYILKDGILNSYIFTGDIVKLAESL